MMVQIRRLENVVEYHVYIDFHSIVSNKRNPKGKGKIVGLGAPPAKRSGPMYRWFKSEYDVRCEHGEIMDEPFEWNAEEEE